MSLAVLAKGYLGPQTVINISRKTLFPHWKKKCVLLEIGLIFAPSGSLNNKEKAHFLHLHKQSISFSSRFFLVYCSSKQKMITKLSNCASFPSFAYAPKMSHFLHNWSVLFGWMCLHSLGKAMWVFSFSCWRELFISKS